MCIRDRCGGARARPQTPDEPQRGILGGSRENPAGLQGTAAVAESKWTEILMENFYLAEKR